MSSKRRFVFQKEQVAISTRKTYTRFALTQARDAMQFCVRGQQSLQQALRWLHHMDEVENLLLESNSLTPEAFQLAEKEQKDREQMMRVLTASLDVLSQMSEEKIAHTAYMESELERVSTQAMREMRAARVIQQQTAKEAAERKQLVPISQLDAEDPPDPRVLLQQAAEAILASKSRKGRKKPVKELPGA